MSSDTLARVQALHDKADQLCDKGHVLRAAEYYERAAEAARALGPDNLVMLHMQLRSGAMHGGYAITAPDRTADLCVRAAHRAEFVALLSDAVAALERRRVAGTLLEGKCAAVEEAWVAGQLKPGDANWPPPVGYERFLCATMGVLNVLASPRVFAAECSAAQFQSFAHHVVHAAELVQQPRLGGVNATPNEAKFTGGLCKTVLYMGAKGLEHGLDMHLQCSC